MLDRAQLCCGSGDIVWERSHDILTISQHGGLSNRDRQLKCQSAWSSATEMWRNGCQDMNRHHKVLYSIKGLGISFFEPFSVRWNTVFSWKRNRVGEWLTSSSVWHRSAWHYTMAHVLEVKLSCSYFNWPNLGMQTAFFLQNIPTMSLGVCSLIFPTTAFGLNN